MRHLLNAISSGSRGGSAWRMPIKDFPPRGTLSPDPRQFRREGTWQRRRDHLRQHVRIRGGRDAAPAAAMLAPQRVPTTEVGGAGRGVDGGKRARRRKRPLLGDTLGVLPVVVVHAATTQGRKGARRALAAITDAFCGWRRSWVGRGDDREPPQQGLAALRPDNPAALEVGKRGAAAKGFGVLPRRWVGERTLGWLGRDRRLGNDDEPLPATARR